LGGDFYASGKLKETDTTHWKSPNMGATNESGFKSLPAGYRCRMVNFLNISYNASWWSSTEDGIGQGGGVGMSNNSQFAFRASALEMFGFSVRCVRD